MGLKDGHCSETPALWGKRIDRHGVFYVHIYEIMFIYLPGRCGSRVREELVKISEANDRRQTELMLALAHAGQTAQALELADRYSAGANVDREQRIFLASCCAQVARAIPPAHAE
jgi:hypothetical protein